MTDQVVHHITGAEAKYEIIIILSSLLIDIPHHDIVLLADDGGWTGQACLGTSTFLSEESLKDLICCAEVQVPLPTAHHKEGGLGLGGVLWADVHAPKRLKHSWRGERKRGRSHTHTTALRTHTLPPPSSLLIEAQTQLVLRYSHKSIGTTPGTETHTTSAIRYSHKSISTTPGTETHTTSAIRYSHKSIGTTPGTERRHLTALMWQWMDSSTWSTVQKGLKVSEVRGGVAVGLAGDTSFADWEKLRSPDDGNRNMYIHTYVCGRKRTLV